jgi:hypothetical protein
MKRVRLFFGESKKALCRVLCQGTAASFDWALNQAMGKASTRGVQHWELVRMDLIDSENDPDGRWSKDFPHLESL